MTTPKSPADPFAALLLEAELIGGFLPISKVGTSLAAVLKRVAATHRPLIITQKGRPTGVILNVALFLALRRCAEHAVVRKGDSTPRDVALTA